MAAVAMGGIGIWCMHFIGNRATFLHDGVVEDQVLYDAGFTALSFFLPIVVLTVAFYFVGVTEMADNWFILLAGLLAGAAVCGMHYVGQLGIINYRYLALNLLSSPHEPPKLTSLIVDVPISQAMSWWRPSSQSSPVPAPWVFSFDFGHPGPTAGGNARSVGLFWLRGLQACITLQQSGLTITHGRTWSIPAASSPQLKRSWFVRFW